MNLILYKTKIKAAKRGHSLLEKKRDTLRTRFKAIMKALKQGHEIMYLFLIEVILQRTRCI